MASIQVWINMVLVLCVVSQYQVICTDRTIHTDLHTYLLEKYTNPHSRPVKTYSHAVPVGFRFAPIMVTLPCTAEFSEILIESSTIKDETAQELQVRGMFLLKWEDDRLTWNETEYEGILESSIPLYKDGLGEPTIWKPELVLYESLGVGFGSFHPETKTVTVKHTGDVYWYSLVTTKTSCTVVVRYYPFDKQICDLTFTTWLYQTNEQVFYTINDILENEVYKMYEVKNGLWEVAIHMVEVGNASYQCISCKGEEQSYVHYKLILMRGQHLLYFFNLVLPCFVMSVMTLIVIWLPEKDVAGAAGLGVTCVLAFFVFLTFLFTRLPSTGLPLIGDYIVWLIAEAAIVTVYAVYRATKAKRKESKQANEGTEQADESGSQAQQSPPSIVNNSDVSNQRYKSESGEEEIGKDVTGNNADSCKALSSSSSKNSRDNKFATKGEGALEIRQTLRGESQTDGTESQEQKAEQKKDSDTKISLTNKGSNQPSAANSGQGSRILKIPSRILRNFQESKNLTKVMIFIKAVTTLVFIIFLFIYIAS